MADTEGCYCDELEEQRFLDLTGEHGFSEDDAEVQIVREQRDGDPTVVCGACRAELQDELDEARETSRAVDAWLEERFERDEDF